MPIENEQSNQLERSRRIVEKVFTDDDEELAIGKQVAKAKKGSLQSLQYLRDQKYGLKYTKEGAGNIYFDIRILSVAGQGPLSELANSKIGMVIPPEAQSPRLPEGERRSEAKKEVTRSKSAPRNRKPTPAMQKEQKSQQPQRPNLSTAR